MPLAATSTDAKSVGDLPLEVTSFIGRRSEVSDTKRLLSASRLVTLTGPGGVGKTRLVLQVAAALRRTFRDGVRFVELAELRDPSLLAYKVAERLDLRDQSARTPIETVIEYLTPRDLLLIFDNCEHLIDECALFIDVIVRACPKVRTLATSREPLSVYGEVTLLIPPLSVPDPADTSLDVLADYSSLQLFVDRARTVMPGFKLTNENCATVANLCRQLDGIPLSIELTTAWLRTLTLQQIEERISSHYRLPSPGSRTAPERHQTLRALVDWSHELCTATEQRIWARASVFSGSFDLPAIEYVGADEDTPAEEILYVIHSLVEKSILIRDEHSGGVRYRMLETLREYGQEQLVAAGGYETIRGRHRDWYANLTEQFQDKWIGPDQESWAQRMRLENSNLRAALDTCLTQSGGTAMGLHLANRIDQHWRVSGAHKEARYWLDRVLEKAPEPTRERASALRFNAWHAMFQGETETGARLLDQASDLAEQLGFDRETAWVMQNRGMAALISGDLREAIRFMSGALEIFRRGGDLNGELNALFMLGYTLGVSGERDRGLSILDECISSATQRGELFWHAYALWSVSCVEVLHGNLKVADSAGKEALRFHRRLDNRQGVAYSMEILAWVNGKNGRHARAATLFGSAAEVWKEVGSTPENFAVFRENHQQLISLTRESMGNDSFEAEFRHGRVLSSEQAVNYALETKTPRKPVSRPEELPLTCREWEIAELVTEGLTNKEIGARLTIAPRTAATHVQNILAKLGLTSRAQIAALFVKAQKTSPEDADT
ncbi:ATP-binding protein [Streptomyces mirabilis]|uniref:ATP-binding protein n=1 Tax=Streptomyces mirabilis TaxID=68239 RepID=UPI003828A80E